HYGDMAALEDACARFLAEAPGPRLACLDDPGAARLAARVTAAGRPVVTYGEDAGADYRLENYRPLGGGAGGLGSRFDLVRGGERLGEIQLPAPGRHNARNAAGAAAVATEIGVPFDAVRAALGRFAGVARRFQFHGEVGDAFADADVVVLTDVYAAGEAPQPGVSGRLILQAVCDRRPAGRVLYVPKRADVLALLPELTRPGDLVVTLGAGDITSLPDEWLRSASA